MLLEYRARNRVTLPPAILQIHTGWRVRDIEREPGRKFILQQAVRTVHGGVSTRPRAWCDELWAARSGEQVFRWGT